MRKSCPYTVKFMSKMRTPPNLADLDAFAAKAAIVSAPPVSDEKSQIPFPPEPEIAMTRAEEPPKSLATSLYFFEEDRKRLEALIGKIKAITPSKKKISVSLVLRGLLLMAEKADPKEVVAAMKEVSF